MDGPMVYEIRVGGELGEKWTTWFDEMSVTTCADGVTVLRGLLPDQAALHGVLAQIRDLGLPLLGLETHSSVGA